MEGGVDADESSAGAVEPATGGVGGTASRNWRDGGRERECTFLVGPTAGGMFSGTDIRLSGGKDMGGMMVGGRGWDSKGRLGFGILGSWWPSGCCAADHAKVAMLPDVGGAGDRPCGWSPENAE
jgi:hypothetical protein